MKKTVLSVVILAVLSGCAATVSPNAFKVSEEQLARREIETRKYTGLKEDSILAASANVLQDLGYNLDNSETKLGLLSASKERDATHAGQVVGAVILALLGGGATAIDKAQKIRVSLVVRPKQMVLNSNSVSTDAQEYFVRISFQRIVQRTDGSAYAETLKDEELYTSFFERLSKSVFIEGQKL